MNDHLSLTGRSWRMRDGSNMEKSTPRDVSAILQSLAVERSLEGENAQGTFPDLPRAIERLGRAFTDKERVGIFGDYDCDGITATAILVRMFRRRGLEPLVRLPHRVHDGYGLSLKLAEELADQGITLLITVDTGITAIEPISLLQARGIDVIVTDHHHLSAEIPSAYAIVHPSLTPGFPLPHPSGAGVAFMLLQALEGETWAGMDTDRALAMIGTVADVVELKGINRKIVQEGLQSLSLLRSGPLAALRDEVRGKGPLRAMDVAFRIAPRINAAGRMDDPMLALTAILDGGAALERLHQLNRARQEITEGLVQDALKKIADAGEALGCIALASEDYPHGVLGLIAGAITESTGRPSLVATIEGDRCTASLRSPSCYHIAEGLHRISHLLHAFGGHAQAAGCSFEREHFEAIAQALHLDVDARVAKEALHPSVCIDAVASPETLTLQAASSLERLEPFGQGNPEPRFLLKNITLSNVRTVGADGAHLQSRIEGIKSIGFRLGRVHPQTGHILDAVCRLGIDTWNGKREVQLFIEDLRIANIPSKEPVPKAALRQAQDFGPA